MNGTLGAICEETKAEAIKGQRMNLIILLVRIILISQVDSDAKELVHLCGLKPKQNRPYSLSFAMYQCRA